MDANFTKKNQARFFIWKLIIPCFNIAWFWFLRRYFLLKIWNCNHILLYLLLKTTYLLKISMCLLVLHLVLILDGNSTQLIRVAHVWWKTGLFWKWNQICNCFRSNQMPYSEQITDHFTRAHLFQNYRLIFVPWFYSAFMWISIKFIADCKPRIYLIFRVKITEIILFFFIKILDKPTKRDII